MYEYGGYDWMYWQIGHHNVNSIWPAIGSSKMQVFRGLNFFNCYGLYFTLWENKIGQSVSNMDKGSLNVLENVHRLCSLVKESKNVCTYII